MKNQFLFSRDSEYFSDNEEIIKLEFCKDKGEACSTQMKVMNGNLLFARQLIEKKEYRRAIDEIRLAHTSTFEIKPEKCQKCTMLFRDTIISSLKAVKGDLEKMTSGLFAKKMYKPDLAEAERLLIELEAKK